MTNKEASIDQEGSRATVHAVHTVSLSQGG
jgi:hypothetical protein